MEGQINKNTNELRIEKIHKMLESTPNDCFLLHALGLEYQKIGNTELAIIYFKKTLQTDENYIGTYYHLAKLYEPIDVIQAKTWYEKGIEIAQKNKEFHLLHELRNAYEDFTEE